MDGFEKLNPLQRLAAENVYRALMTAENFSLLKETLLKGRVLDFGCDMGGSTWYLQKIGADVTAIDLEDMSELRNLGIVPEEKIIQGDGIAYMSAYENTFDIVTSTMFGPDLDGVLSDQFVRAARKAVKKGGLILVFSEISSLRRLAEAAGSGAVRLDNNTLYFAKVSPPDASTTYGEIYTFSNFSTPNGTLPNKQLYNKIYTVVPPLLLSELSEFQHYLDWKGFEDVGAKDDKKDRN